jgi:methylated-DNA-protein-cysteine methyltransferase-like protein
VTIRGAFCHNARVPRAVEDSYARIYAVTRRIPRGRVATYGQVALLAGLPGHARQVGYALHSMATEGPIPWHRVINARGEISLRSQPGGEARQRRTLEGEGIAFDAEGRVDLARYQWRPRASARRGKAPG